LSAAFSGLTRASTAERGRRRAHARVVIQPDRASREIYVAARATARRCGDSQTGDNPK